MGDYSESRSPKHPRIASYPSSQEDLFIKLTDDIIIHILSKLSSMKERGITSVLSHRWRNLWKSSIGTNLIFDRNLYEPLKDSRANFGRIIDRYINLVNLILGLYKEPTLDEFAIRFNIHSPVLDDWLEFALRKGVKRLQLDLSPIGVEPRVDLECRLRYIFPSTKKMLISSGLGTLRELSLTYLIVCVKDFQHILSGGCPFLECLHMLKIISRSSAQLEVVGGPSFRLKHLEIVGCILDKVVISAPNLASLSYDGPEKSLILENVPLLQDLRMGGGYLQHFIYNPSSHFPYFFQLKKLALQLSPQAGGESSSLPFELPNLIKLEELEVTVEENCSLPILWPSLLLKAAPSVHRFAVKLLYRMAERMVVLDEAEHVPPEDISTTATICKHKCLKVVEVAGYMGGTLDLDLVRQLLCIAEALEKLILDTTWVGPAWNSAGIRFYMEFSSKPAKERAKQELLERLPCGAKLVLI